MVLRQQDRVVIPAQLRATLGLQPADVLHLHVEDARLVLERPHRAAAQLRGLARPATGRSLLDELLAERRAEVTAS